MWEVPTHKTQKKFLSGKFNTETHIRLSIPDKFKAEEHTRLSSTDKFNTETHIRLSIPDKFKAEEHTGLSSTDKFRAEKHKSKGHEQKITRTQADNARRYSCFPAALPC
jgi:hypothetical protein